MDRNLATDVACHEVCHAKNPNHDHAHWASFVSPDGLIVTNHHCATGGLQFNSTPERSLLKDGYLEKTREDELSMGPGSRVWVTTSVAEAQLEIREVRLVYAPDEGIGVFDGTYESVSSDYLFDAVKTRSIHVDSRYMMWTMAEVDGALRLLEEMGVSLAPPAVAPAPAVKK